MIVLLIFLGLLLIFYMSLFLGKYLTKKSTYVKRIGESIYKKKIKQYNSNAFKPLRNAVDKKSVGQGMGFIAPMIILKSIAFYFISLLLITPIIVLFQGLAMGSMFVYHEKQIGSTNELSKITFWQLFSHLIIASFGCVKGLDWLFNVKIIANTHSQFLSNINAFLILSIITAIVAAFFEVRALLNEHKV